MLQLRSHHSLSYFLRLFKPDFQKTNSGAKSFVTAPWDPVSFYCDACLISRPVSVLTVRVNILQKYFSFLLCCCYMDTKMQTMSNGYSMKRTTAVQLCVPLITIYYPTPVCQSSFQWPVLSSHWKIDTGPFPMLSASCRPSGISSDCFSLPDSLCSPFYTRFLLVSALMPLEICSDLSLHYHPVSHPGPYHSFTGTKYLFQKYSYSGCIYLLDIQSSLWNTEIGMPQLTLDNFNDFFPYQGILGHFS